MDQTERQIIDDLFAKLRQAEAQSGPRAPQADAHIREHVARLPAAPYLMAQAIVMLEQALAASQARNEELEQQLRAPHCQQRRSVRWPLRRWRPARCGAATACRITVGPAPVPHLR